MSVLQASMPSSHFDMMNNQPYCNADNQQWSSHFNIWTTFQSQNSMKSDNKPAAEYVHPRPGLMSQNSLEICTESLGSETGSDGFYDGIILSPQAQTDDIKREMATDEDEQKASRGAETRSVNYHSSTGRRSPPRSFPPPLPSISRRDGSCIHMRPHRRDGRLVVEAVSVPSQNYLHARREGGRLLLSFVAPTSVEPIEQESPVQEDEDEEEFEEEEEEEEVEVVDRGNVVEVKVSSTQSQQQGGVSAGAKVHRSSLVINKFVSGSPRTAPASGNDDVASTVKRAVASTTETSAKASAPCKGKSSQLDKEYVGTGTKRAVASTTAASAVVVASALSSVDDDVDCASMDNKLSFTSKQRNREEMVNNMMRCSELRRPLFIYEPCCIASS